MKIFEVKKDVVYQQPIKISIERREYYLFGWRFAVICIFHLYCTESDYLKLRIIFFGSTNLGISLPIWRR